MPRPGETYAQVNSKLSSANAFRRPISTPYSIVAVHFHGFPDLNTIKACNFHRVTRHNARVRSLMIAF